MKMTLSISMELYEANDQKVIEENKQKQLTEIVAKDLESFERDTRRRPFVNRVRENWPKCIILLLLMAASLRDLYINVSYDDDDDNLVYYLKCVAAVLGGLFATDLLVGAAHLGFDHVRLQAVPAESKPLLQWLAYGFQIHHAIPTSWTDADFFYLGILRTGFIGFVPFSLLQLVLSHFGFNWHGRLFVACWAWSLLVCQIPHAVAHGRWRKSPFEKLFSALQYLGIFVRPAFHHEHHTHFDRNFTIFNSWAEPLVQIMYQIATRFNWIADEMHPSVQREVYIIQKESLKRPYLAMFADCRPAMSKRE